MVDCNFKMEDGALSRAKEAFLAKSPVKSLMWK